MHYTRCTRTPGSTKIGTLYWQWSTDSVHDVDAVNYTFHGNLCTSGSVAFPLKRWGWGKGVLREWDMLMQAQCASFTQLSLTESTIVIILSSSINIFKSLSGVHTLAGTYTHVHICMHDKSNPFPLSSLSLSFPFLSPSLYIHIHNQHAVILTCIGGGEGRGCCCLVNDIALKSSVTGWSRSRVSLRTDILLLASSDDVVEIIDSRFELKFDELVEAESCPAGESHGPPSPNAMEILPDSRELMSKWRVSFHLCRSASE